MGTILSSVKTKKDTRFIYIVCMYIHHIIFVSFKSQYFWACRDPTSGQIPALFTINVRKIKYGGGTSDNCTKIVTTNNKKFDEQLFTLSASAIFTIRKPCKHSVTWLSYEQIIIKNMDEGKYKLYIDMWCWRMAWARDLHALHRPSRYTASIGNFYTGRISRLVSVDYNWTVLILRCVDRIEVV